MTIPKGQHIRSSTRAGAPAALFGALACIGAVLARPGPDIVPTDLEDTISYGTVSGSGIWAYDVGSVSCNAGNVNILWEGSTPQHPVIAQNIYRLKAGRFEHVGMAWAKHGFYAAAEAGCNYICNGRGADQLGVGCSDPYTGGSNGIQFFLGPRSEINPSTGAFAYNANTPNTWPPYSGTIARRIQIPTADVNPALNGGAMYAAEVVYVSAHDSGAANNANNAAWRRIAFGADATFSSTFLGMPATRVGAPGILAWKEFDPTVKLAAIDVPGDGRFWIGQKVTDNGNGTWHYEFAVENVSSDRAGGSFVVATPAGTSVTNAEFRALAYHSGETWTSTAWSISTAGNAVTFSTPQTFAQNPSTSAIRWATLDNFRFDANQPPAYGIARLGLFKPGSPSDMPVGLLTPGGASVSFAAPSNDACAGAVAAHAGQNAFQSLGAGSSGPAACLELGSSNLLADTWFTYTYNDTCAGTITFSTCGSDFDTKLAVYQGSNCSLGPLLGCSDDSGSPCTGSTNHSFVSVAASPGATYLVRVGSRTGATGNGMLTIEVPRCVPPPGACCYESGDCFIAEGQTWCIDQGATSFLGDNTTCSPNNCPQPPRPPNDDCVNAIALADINAPGSGGAIVRSTTVWALPVPAEGDFTLCNNHANNDVWFRYTPANTASVTVSVCDFQSGDMTNPAMEIRSGSCAGGVILCHEDGCGPNGLQPTVTLSMTGGTTYYIRVFPSTGFTAPFGIKVAGGGGTLAGACCSGSSCSIVLPSACVGPSDRFISTGASCNPPANTVTPCCKADFNQSGQITVQDLFDFLAAFFSSSTAADINGSGTVTPQDLFTFLAAWFAKAC